MQQKRLASLALLVLEMGNGRCEWDGGRTIEVSAPYWLLALLVELGNEEAAKMLRSLPSQNGKPQGKTEVCHELLIEVDDAAVEEFDDSRSVIYGPECVVKPVLARLAGVQDLPRYSGLVEL